MSLLEQGKTEDALSQIEGPSSAAYQKQATDGTAMLAALERFADDSFEQLIVARNYAYVLLGIGIVIAVAIVIGTMQWFRTRMLNSVGRVVASFEAMGSGDLSQRIRWQGTDLLARLGEGIDDLGDRLASMISQIQLASITVAGASEQSTQLALEVDGRVKEELSALDEALTYSGELAGAAGTVAENADAVARRVSDISSAVAQMTASIHEMDQNLLNLATVVEQAVANTQEMSASIVQVAGNAERVRSESNITDQQVRDGRNEVRHFQAGWAASAIPSPTSFRR